MINIENRENCCGCTACQQVCPKKCIVMTPDALGFLYPKVSEALCIECGLCEKVCSFNKNYDISSNLDTPDVYAVRHKDMREIETSRSGAMFIAISDWILDREGVVYGVGYLDHFRVAHKRAITKDARDEFKGSKYVQSDLGNCFDQVKQDLKKGLFVMFSGTPCQTSGLRSYLNNIKCDISKLFVCDIVCHGVPSPYFWRDYLEYMENKVGMMATDVNFRDKSKLGWSSHKESFKFGDKYIYTDTYTHVFFQHIMLRHSCGVCHYTNFQHPSDITIADFWGWQNVDPAFNADNKGVSLVLINNYKGSDLFEAVKDQLNFIKTTTESCLQPNLQRPTIINSKRDDFEKDFDKRGLVYVCKKYGNTGWTYPFRFHLGRVKRLLLRIINK